MVIVVLAHHFTVFGAGIEQRSAAHQAIAIERADLQDARQRRLDVALYRQAHLEAVEDVRWHRIGGAARGQHQPGKYARQDVQGSQLGNRDGRRRLRPTCSGRLLVNNKPEFCRIKRLN